MPNKTIFADVQWWDCTHVTIRCPFCDKLHTHGFGSSYEASRRVPHCGFDATTSSLEYTFRYPFSKSCDTAAYEIDKVNKRFVALGAQLLSNTRLATLEEDFFNLSVEDSPTETESSWEQAREEITLDLTDPTFRNLQRVFGGDETFAMKRFDHVLHRMLSYGDTEYVQAFLDTSSDSSIFLQGRDPDRQTTLICAACEKHPDIVRLLLQYGANPNVRDNKGRSPLMEASLWGRFANVKHLLAFGARKDLQDKMGLRAIDFAEKSDRNDEERFWRAGAEAEVYKENAFLANRERRLIRCLLEDEVNDEDPVIHTFRRHVFVKTSPLSLELLGPLANYSLSTEWKTIARLGRGGKYPQISAMSGWAHDNDVTVVSGRDWTTDVMRISNLIGHKLSPDARKDHGEPGRFYASHAEKQLIAYFISKHLFLPDETRAGEEQIDPQPRETSEEALLRLRKESEQKAKSGPLCELAKRLPPVTTRRANILVSKEPCGDCAKFNAAVNSNLNLEITLEVGPTILMAL